MSINGAPGQVGEDWITATRASLSAAMSDDEAGALLDRVCPCIPAGYDELNWPNSAVVDLPIIDRMAASAGAERVATAMMQFAEAPAHEWRFRVYHAGSAVPISDLLPLLDVLGLRAIDERASNFRFMTGSVWVHDVGVQVPAGVELTAALRDELQRTFLAEFDRSIEVDSLNRLVLLAGLTHRQVEVLRAYSRYMRQTNFPFSQDYVAATLADHAPIAKLIVDRFAARFDPSLDNDDRSERSTRLHEDAIRALDDVPSLDHDRTLRSFLGLVEATVRTNAYRPGLDGGHRDVIAFKFDTTLVPDLPLPRPMFEVWVCSPRVEGVHLRNGRIARGGIRWSDRREDFRTEVLGLVKAQIVKNAVIVPTGAKGGFVLKRPPVTAAEQRAEGVECYRRFVAGLLDVTDNIVDGVVVPPPDTVRHDDDDPYLVVAADKGTATFSDIANGIAAEYKFWLGDAFASGGSAGYDHKEMGITARGAWESVRRHSAVLGKDVDKDELTVVGVGDMSGDVFGNGMLQSTHLKLVAAFDHRHVFVDPDPDPAVSYAERRRLYDLAGSSWADYDPTLISAGGEVYPRTLKTIELSSQAQRALGTERTSFTPSELISTILRAPVDLLWNGGIGTYVKASSESHADVGDRTNDALRVNGAELRARMVGEGGNLGLTQLARVEYALAGGLINTDAIDNSAGVDCSDHEVNIKILLGLAMEQGELTLDGRNELLVAMTDEVAELVLDDNRAQTLALAIARRLALPMINVHSRYLNLLEAEGWLNRALEFLPTDRQIAERQSTGNALMTPEFAVLMAYTKSANVTEAVRSDLPDDPYLQPDLIRYFPHRLRRDYHDEILRHRLRREIVATQVCNQMTNLQGISFDHRMAEETGVSVVEITRAWIAARDIIGLTDLWEQVEGLTGAVRLEMQIEMFMELRSLAERCALWLLRHRRLPLDIPAAVDAFHSGMTALVELEGTLCGRLRDEGFAAEARRLAGGVPEALAQRSAQWSLMHTGLDMIEVSRSTGRSLTDVARIYWKVFDVLDLTWLWDAVGALPRSDRWQTQARSALRDDLLVALADLSADVIRAGIVEDWETANQRLIARTMAMFTELRRVEVHDVTTLSVAVRQLRTLALLS